MSFLNDSIWENDGFTVYRLCKCLLQKVKNASKQCLHETVPLNIINTVHNNQNKYDYYQFFLEKMRFGIFYVRYTIQDPA